MSMQSAFVHVAAMAGVKPPEAGARYLRGQIERFSSGVAREHAEAEVAKWFRLYRGGGTPRSIAAYMASVQAALDETRAVGSGEAAGG